MNQILSTENISNKGKYNKGSQKDIKTVIKFFAIILIIFGIFITASSSYALYKNNEKKEVPTTKPEIVLENKNEDQLILKVMHGQIIDNVIYYWNNEEENRINGKGGKYVEKTLDIPNGENTLHVIAKDINNMTQEVNKTYTKTAQSGNVNIEIKLSGNNISISFTSEEKISKLTKCDTHTKIGVSSDEKYDCYFSTNSGSEIKLLNEFKKTEIQIIEKKERPKNGFVLSEKTDLENTEAFKK